MKSTFILFLFSSLLFSADIPRTYYVYSYPKGSLTCNEEAVALATRMQVFPNLKVLNQGCYKDLGNVYDLFVMYTANPQPVLVTTHFDDVFPCTYSSLDACQLALPEEIEVFERKTGLKSFNGYCYRESGASITSTPYNLLIEAFGDPIAKPRVDKNALMARPMVDVNEFAKSVSSSIKKLGFDIAQVVFRREGDSFWSLITRYYSKKRAPFILRQLSKFYSAERCLEVAQELEPLFQKWTPGTLSTFCAEVGSPNYYTELYVYRLESEATLSLTIYPQPYQTKELCQANRAKVLDLYINEMKRPAFATLCESGSDGYKIKVFESYTL